MEFLLIYKGRLKGHAPAKEKNLIRKAIDPQLRSLLEKAPLSAYREYLPGGKQEAESPFVFKQAEGSCPT